jgi:hypothetical protein
VLQFILELTVLMAGAGDRNLCEVQLRGGCAFKTRHSWSPPVRVVSGLRARLASEKHTLIRTFPSNLETRVTLPGVGLEPNAAARVHREGKSMAAARVNGPSV